MITVGSTMSLYSMLLQSRQVRPNDVQKRQSVKQAVSYTHLFTYSAGIKISSGSPFTAHQRGFGFVTVEGEPDDIFIPARCV